MRGLSLSATGPGTSAEKSCMPPIPKMGKMARLRTIIPIPPSHCVMLRQKSIPFGNDSMSFRMDDPVVVKPDMVSKKAFVKSGIEWLRIKGKLPKNEKRTQTRLTITNPSRLPISLPVFLNNTPLRVVLNN